MDLKKPKALPQGGTIGIIAPAGPVNQKCVEAGEAKLRAAGFRTLRRADLTDCCGYFAGSDARRAAEFMEFVCDERVDAILCARGGYGSMRILAQLDAAIVRAAAKPLIGYSDATTLLLWQRACAGLVGFHGPMLERGEDLSDEELAASLALLMGKPAALASLAGSVGGGGRAEGPLVGGSLSLIVASLGTPWEIDTRGAILLFEEVGERPYRIDRMLQQLKAAKKLEGLAGIACGSLTACEDPRYSAPTAEAVVREVCETLSIPWLMGLPFGHAPRNLPWGYGVRGAIDGQHREVSILEQGVV